MAGTRYSRPSFEEHGVLTLGLELGLSLRQVAQQLGRAPSTLCRKVSRNRMGLVAPYRSVPAPSKALTRAYLARRAKKLDDHRLWRFTRRALRCRWSPEQIAEHLRTRYPQDMSCQVSDETIYVLPRGELRKGLLSYLRHAQQTQRLRSRGKDRHGQIPNLVSIHERPAEVDRRLAPAHWESNILDGTISGGTVGALVERRARMVLLAILGDCHAATANPQLCYAARSS